MTAEPAPTAPLVAPPLLDVSPPAPALDPLEIAYGVVVGRRGRTSTPRPPAKSVADALDDAIRPALQRAPCLVSFSGGRDSSALLAWTTRLARREGHELPVPATLVIPGDSDADEAEWQSLVLGHLGLGSGERFTIRDELDCVGPVATAALRRHGVLWPFNTHMHIPIFAAAANGSVITGFGGDELGRSSQLATRAARIIARQKRKRASDALVLALAFAPGSVRRSVYARRARRDLRELPWLTKRALSRIGRRIGDDDAAVPIRWDKILTEWWPDQRYFATVRQSFEAAAAPWNVKVVHPFADHTVLSSLAAMGGATGLGSRAELMRVMFGDLLPDEILFRESKAAFSNVLYTDTARRFAAEWSGGGLDPTLVDTDRLRAHWLGTEPADMRSMALLQMAWLHDHPTG